MTVLFCDSFSRGPGALFILVALVTLLGQLACGARFPVRPSADHLLQKQTEELTVLRKITVPGRSKALKTLKRLPPTFLTDDAYPTVFSPQSMELLPKLKEPSTEGFNLDRAVLFGRLTSVSYCHNLEDVQGWNCTRCAEIPTMQHVTVVYDPLWDLLGYVGYLPDLRSIVVVFRGTDSSSFYNWMDNLRAWRTDHMYPLPQQPHAKIHSGFYLLWSASSLQDQVTGLVGELIKLYPNSGLYVTGHSMGGALAHLCALDMKYMYNITDVYVYTFGSPRLGNIEFADLFQSSVKEAWRVTHSRDIVPSVPFMVMGFHHAAREVWQTEVQNGTEFVETKLYICDSTGEDPTCHNNACYLGICTSVADHLVYLGIHLYHDILEC